MTLKTLTDEIIKNTVKNQSGAYQTVYQPLNPFYQSKHKI